MNPAAQHSRCHQNRKRNILVRTSFYHALLLPRTLLATCFYPHIMLSELLPTLEAIILHFTKCSIAYLWALFNQSPSPNPLCPCY